MARVVQSQRIPHPPDSYSFFDYIAGKLHNQIRTNTCTTDLRPYIQEFIDDNFGYRAKWFPSGYYPMDVSTTALRVTAPSTRLWGPGFSHQSPAIFVATGNTIAGTDHTGMMVIDNTQGTELRGLTFDRNTTQGDGLILTGPEHFGMFDCSYYNHSGVKYKTGNSANPATDIITGPSGTSAFINVGDRIEFWVASSVVAGDALPGGLQVQKGYFVVFKSGNTFQVSTTPGGSPVNITANGVGTWGFHKFSYTWESSSIVNNTIGVVGHGFVVGHKVTFSNPASLGALVTMPTFINPGQSYYVVEVPDANSFKVSLSQGGTPVTVTTTGSLSLKPQVSLEYCPIRGSDLLYGRIDNCRISAANSGIKLLRGEGGGHQWYGMNVGTITRVTGAAGHTFDGIMKVASSSFEGSVVSPNEAVVRTAGAGVHLDHVYYEGTRANVNPVGMKIEGYTMVTACSFIGTTKQEIGSMGIAIKIPGGACGPIIGNFIGSYDYGRAYLLDMPGTADFTDFVSFGNDFQNCNRELLITNDVRTGTTLRRYLQHVPGLGYCIGGSWVQELRQSANNPTSLELGLGNVRQIEGNAPHTISSVTTAGTAGVAGAYGWVGTLIANSPYTILAASLFATHSGADYLMRQGEALTVAVDAAGKLHLIGALGTVVARTPAALSGTLSSTVGDTNLLSAAPTTGKFTVDVYGTVLTAGAGTTTLTLPLKWTDAKAARTENMVTAFDLVAGATYFRARLSVSVASGNITLGATFNTPSGTPGVVLDVTVTKDS